MLRRGAYKFGHTLNPIRYLHPKNHLSKPSPWLVQSATAMATSSNGGNKHLNELLSTASSILGPSQSGMQDHEYRILDTKNLKRCMLQYDSLSRTSDDRRKFLLYLCQRYGTDQGLISKQCKTLLDCVKDERGERTLLKAQHRLKHVLIPKYQGLFTQLGSLESGVKFLIDMRYDAIHEAKKGTDGDALKHFSEYLGDILRTWFSVGLLHLERITWETPADVLEKIGKYEAVHMVKGWMDLKHRLGPSRRCYAFFHKNMPREPVIVLHVALTSAISDNISDILNYKTEVRANKDKSEMVCDDPRCAIFYSITSTQKGLQGIELGAYLIQAVVDRLKAELLHLNQFSSLSPIPGFTKWLNAEISCGGISKYLEELPGESSTVIQQALKGLVGDGTILLDKPHHPILKPVLVKLCAAYLCCVKRRGYAIDPVANFHLKNGAVVWRINWMADNSPAGMRQSYGLMVNYRYYLEDMGHNSSNYAQNKAISMSDPVRDLLPANVKQCFVSSKL